MAKFRWPWQDKAKPAPVAPKASPALVGDSYLNLAANLGVTAPNLSNWSTYDLNPITRQRMLLDWMYRGSWVIGVAVDAYAEDMTREWVTYTGDTDPEDLEKIEGKTTELNLKGQTASWIKWSRLYGGAIAIMLIDGHDVSTPLDVDTIGKDQFKGLYVYDRWLLKPTNTDLVQELGPHFGTPEFYSPVGEAPVYRGEKIHHTRVMRMDGYELPYFQRLAEAGWGMSIVERIWDRLQAFDSATTGGAQLIYKAYLRTLKVNGLRKILAAGGALQAAFQKNVEAIRSMQASEGITVVDGEDEFETHTYSFAGIADLINVSAQQVCGALQMPMVRLMGEGAGGLNADDSGALRVWDDGIGKEQEARLRPQIGALFDVLYRSTLDKPPPSDFNFKFNPLWTVSKAEQAEIAGSVTATVLSAFQQGVVTQKLVLQELRQASELTGVWTNIDDEMINKAEDDFPEPPQPGDMGGDNPFGGKGGDKPPGQGGSEIKVEHPSGGKITVKSDSNEGKKDVTDAFDPNEDGAFDSGFDQGFEGGGE